MGHEPANMLCSRKRTQASSRRCDLNPTFKPVIDNRSKLTCVSSITLILRSSLSCPYHVIRFEMTGFGIQLHEQCCDKRTKAPHRFSFSPISLVVTSCIIEPTRWDHPTFTVSCWLWF